MLCAAVEIMCVFVLVLLCVCVCVLQLVANLWYSLMCVCVCGGCYSNVRG